MAKTARRQIRLTEQLNRLLDEISKRRGETFNGTVMRMLWDQVESEMGQKVVKLAADGVPKQQQNGSILATDPRHALVREFLAAKFEAVFKVACTWDGSEAGALSGLLRANPSWTLAQIRRMVENYLASEGVTPERPRVWLQSLGKYAAGKLDRFGRVWKPEAARPLNQNDASYRPPPMVNALDEMRRQRAEAEADEQRLLREAKEAGDE